jgi:hypothetical protein
MFSKQHADEHGWLFSSVAAASLGREARVLLDESLDDLAVYDDPDPGVYDPEPSQDTIQRAEFKRQAARWDASLKQQSSQTEESDSEPRPSASAIADTALLAMILRDALYVQLDYPEVGAAPQHVALTKDVRDRLARALDRPGMARLKTLATSASQIDEVSEPMRWGMFSMATAMWHPDLSDGKVTDSELPAATERAVQLCAKTAAPDISAIVTRLGEFMMVSCRRPTGSHDPAFKDPARAVYLLDRYWRHANRLVQTQMQIQVGYSPHPLTRIIENLRDRIAGCFEILKEQPDATRVAEDLDRLLSLLSEGDGEDMVAMEEWAVHAIRRIELFIARMGMSLGIWHGGMTQAESFFVSHVEPMIADYCADVKSQWRRRLQRADVIGAKNAAEQRSVSASPPPAGPPEGAAPADINPPPPPPPPPPVQKGPRVVLGKRGETCFVDGKEMPPLTDGRYAVIEGLISAGDEGLTKDSLEEIRSGARSMLEKLSEKYSEWAAVIQMAGQTNGRYRIRL